MVQTLRTMRLRTRARAAARRRRRCFSAREMRSGVRLGRAGSGSNWGVFEWRRRRNRMEDCTLLDKNNSFRP